MNVRKYSCAIVLTVVALYACNNDDDNDGLVAVPPRDLGEQQKADDAILQDYLSTHFYTLEDVDLNGDSIAEYRVAKFDTIADENSSQPSILSSGLLTTKKVTVNDVEHNLYVLGLREGVNRQPTFADSITITYRGELLYSDTEDNVFDSAITQVEFDLAPLGAGIIRGFREAVLDFKGATSLFRLPDGTPSASDDFGELIVFIPSGLAYFNDPPSGSGIPLYAPLIFNIQLYRVNEADHDRDGLPSYLEDLDGDGIVSDLDDDTDEDLTPNFADSDDDGDGTQTRDEITVKDLNDDGFITLDEITFYDDDGDGTPNHLDPDDRDSKNEQ